MTDRAPGQMHLSVLGAGPAYTDRPGATGAAYLVRHRETSLLLDLGQGSFPALASRVEPSRLDAVIVSHLHPDHFIDLVSLRHYLRYEFDPSRRVSVMAPDGLAERIDALHDEPGFCAAALDVTSLAPGLSTVGDLTAEASRVTHIDESYAVRVCSRKGGRGLVYSGDCGRADDLAPLIRPGDTLLAEISFGAGPVPADVPHLDGPAVGRLAAGTEAGRVLLTHLQMGFDPAEAVASVERLYGGPVELVEPGFETMV